MKIYENYFEHADRIYRSKSATWDFTKFAINKLDLKKKINSQNSNKIKSLYIAYFEKKFFYESWNFFFKDKLIVELNILFYRVIKSLIKEYNKNINTKDKIFFKYSFKNKYKYFLKFFFVKVFNFIFFNKYNKNRKVGITLIEGLDLSKRNDLFWISHIKIKPKNIIFYIDDLSSLRRIKNIIILIFKYRIKGYSFFSFIKEDKYFKSNLNKKNLYNIFINNEISFINKKANMWSNFFKNNNIVLHQENAEANYDPIFRQIACLNLDIKSFSKCRSVTMPYLKDFVNYHNTDFFFVWDDVTKKRLKKSLNIVDNIIDIGKLYDKDNNDFIEEKNEISLIKSKYKILINLSNFSKSNLEDDYDEVLPKLYVKNYFRLFLRIAKKNNIVFIVKCKKQITEFYDLTKYLADQSEINKYFYVIKEPFQKFSYKYCKYVDFSINFGIYLPSVMLENFIYTRTKSVYLDYPNIKNNEQIFFKTNLNNLFFNNLKNFGERFINFLNDNDDDFGNWYKDFDNYNNNHIRNIELLKLFKHLNNEI